ncbi:MAG TPA: site-specific integrase [Pedobacter sp.]|uniref:tyrosine-type recombinase/integrase n=1 Tax=Pedobacter sp. TaxID=1411316 RepID=UPI002B9F0EEF|nr:site-specific integrase [Pedobacter sp.]HMI01256.1 site-specific integrase [Pedobacter sp.]
MATPEIPYTIPKLVKGKRVTTVPKGSTWAKEEAKQNWYVEFFFHNAETDKMERFRPTKNLNRLKDPKEKLMQFTRLCEAYKIALEGGWSPIDEKANDRLKRQVSSLTLEAAKTLFEEYHIAKGTRKKSRQSYLSKLNQFIAYYGQDKKVSEISDYEITEFLNFMEKDAKWTGVTYNSSRIILNNYFKYLKVNKYISENPVTDIETRTKIATESHQIFSDKDFKTIMKWLNEHDHYCLFFVKMIYYTCIRPKELRYLQLKHINLEHNVITVPASIAKNKKSLPISIDASLCRELKELKVSSYPVTDYLLGSTDTIIGEKRIGENTPYNRFQKCLKATKLDKKNYTLYSFKHFSNVKKFKAGWTLAEICSANRHGSLVETETYLKDLLKFVKNDKAIPKI